MELALANDLISLSLLKINGWRKNGNGVVVFLVALIVILALGLTVWAGLSVYCISKGMQLDTSFGWTTVWKIGMPYIQFRCYR